LAQVDNRLGLILRWLLWPSFTQPQPVLIAQYRSTFIGIRCNCTLWVCVSESKCLCSQQWLRNVNC